MTSTFTYSSNYHAKMKRIQRLPRRMDGFFTTSAKKDAVGLIDTFRDGIIKDDFGLEPLKPSTVKSKAGMPKPTTPLFGLGDTIEKKSYLNMLRIRKIKRGFKVFPSWAKHHTSKLQLRWLFIIHEYGAIIRQNRGGKIVLIRIPPRPAFRKSYDRYMGSKSKREPTDKVSKAIIQLIKTGISTKLDNINKGKLDKYDEKDD